MPLDHPYENLTGGAWVRGNLHTHTTASDGQRPIQEVIDDYAARGYDFLMISDHDVFTGADDYAKVDSKGMVLLPGNEISKHGPHLLHVGATRRVEPQALRQQVILDANAAGGFVVVPHPNWGATFNHCPLQKLQEWVGYIGVEVHNGVIGRLHGSPYCTDKWDILLTEGRRLWGFAHDDSHRVEDVELGWNVVYTTERTSEAIIAAMAAGRFYPSTGVVIRSIEVLGMRIRVQTENARRVVALRDTGKRIATTDGDTLEIEVPQDAKYVRFECWGDGEQFAWTQPFFITAAE